MHYLSIICSLKYSDDEKQFRWFELLFRPCICHYWHNVKLPSLLWYIIWYQFTFQNQKLQLPFKARAIFICEAKLAAHHFLMPGINLFLSAFSVKSINFHCCYSFFPFHSLTVQLRIIIGSSLEHTWASMKYWDTILL